MDATNVKYQVGDYSAENLLLKARETILQRGAVHDAGRERSMDAAVRIFGAITNDGEPDVPDGWLFMIALKLARIQGRKFNADDYIDLIAYAALYAESVIDHEVTSVHGA